MDSQSAFRISFDFLTSKPVVVEPSAAQVSEILSNLVDEIFQAATLSSLIPSMNLTPRMTSGMIFDALSSLHLREAESMSLKTIVRQAILDPLPLVRRCRSRTVANVDSIGLVVRKCTQCSAGKS